MGRKLYVGNLSFKATEENLRELFSQAGEIESVRIITDTRSGQPRGFGFVEMASNEAAQQAIAMFNGKNFMERPLIVNEARPQQKRERDFGSSRGRGGFRQGGGGRKRR